MSETFKILEAPPSSFEDLKTAVAARKVTFPLRVENVARKVIACPELMAFESTPSIAERCGVSASTVMRFIAHIGFHDLGQARGIFRDELRRRVR
jgi:DNA-binding MurR/RpiR family transcriptional regulator